VDYNVWNIHSSKYILGNNMICIDCKTKYVDINSINLCKNCNEKRLRLFRRGDIEYITQGLPNVVSSHYGIMETNKIFLKKEVTKQLTIGELNKLKQKRVMIEL